MKNKNLLLLLGVGVAYYLFYKMYANKSSNDIIKNTWSGKTKLHEFNFPEDSEITYEKYLELIGK